MTDSNVSRPSLTQLYRRFVGQSTTVLDACGQQGLEACESAPTSSLYADLHRLSRDLEPASAQLSADLAKALAEVGQFRHRQTTIPRRAVHAGSRRWRGIAALAASFVAVVALWTTQQGRAPVDRGTAALSAKAQDQIFKALGDVALAGKNQSDQIFRDEFVSDEIFSSRSHNG